jgi:hypothetical protein
MTRKTNARVAGITFLAYIAFGIASMVLSGRATAGVGVAAKLATLAQHTAEARATVVLTLLCAFCAIVLGVTLHALTRDEDPDLATMGLACRVAEGVVAAVSLQRSLALLWLVTAGGASAPGPAASQTLATYLLHGEGGAIAAILFAVGSSCFCWVLLRGRMIPVPMAWLGVVASVLLVAVLPLQLAGLLPGGYFTGALNTLIWLPMLVFELAFAFWLIVKGVAAPAPQPALARRGEALLAGG